MKIIFAKTVARAPNFIRTDAPNSQMREPVSSWGLRESVQKVSSFFFFTLSSSLVTRANALQFANWNLKNLAAGLSRAAAQQTDGELILNMTSADVNPKSPNAKIWDSGGTEFFFFEIFLDLQSQLLHPTDRKSEISPTS